MHDPAGLHAGLCYTTPAAGLNLPLGLGLPLFYFPLTNGSLQSFPWGSRQGSAEVGALC